MSSSRKASVAKCVVRPWNSTQSVGERAEAESTSWTFRNQVYVVSQVYTEVLAWPDKDE